MLNFDPLLWSHPDTGGHHFNKFESTLYQNAFTCLVIFDSVVLEKIFKDISLFKPMLNFGPRLWPHPDPGDHHLNKLESTFYQNAST